MYIKYAISKLDSIEKKKELLVPVIKKIRATLNFSPISLLKLEYLRY